MNTMKRFGVIATIGIAGALAAPQVVNADPTARTEESVTFPGFDPCTGTPHMLTVDTEVRTHQHRNTTVITYRPSGGSTDSGYLLKSSSRTTVLNPNTISDRLIEIWQHPDGRKMRAQVVVVIDAGTGMPRVLRTPPDTVSCIGGPTIMP